MSLESITKATVKGKAIGELQGLHSVTVAGASAGTKMDVASLRDTDTLVSAIVNTYAAGAVDTHADDLANVTIQSVKASATLTISGNPVNAEVFTINGVTYTFKTVPAAATDVLITSGDNTAMAAAVAAVVNAYESRWTGNGYAKPSVKATSAAGVVTLTATVDGLGNAPVVTDTGSTITVSSTDPVAVTATFVSAGNTDALTVNGVVFTIKTVPVNLEKDIAVLGTNTLQAAEMARVINAYENKYLSLDVAATSALGVVTITPRTAFKGHAVKLTETATNVALSSTALAGGTTTGGVKSTTDLTSKSLTLTWFEKPE